jgi:hypothetical protein
MTPIVVFWTNYTATVLGHVLKLVPCEHCQTEYVYVLEREGVGAGTSVYGLYSETAQDNAETGAHEVLEQYLANDFDPVPCPKCGHYQRFMFPKLMETRSLWVPVARVASLFVGSVSFIGAIYWGINYVKTPSDYALWRLVLAASLAALACVVGMLLSAVEQRRIRLFDPNDTEDLASRLAKGKSRALTRVEFDAMQQTAK